jgi:hypothetical protein
MATFLVKILGFGAGTFRKMILYSLLFCIVYVASIHQSDIDQAADAIGDVALKTMINIMESLPNHDPMREWVRKVDDEFRKEASSVIKSKLKKFKPEADTDKLTSDISLELKSRFIDIGESAVFKKKSFFGLFKRYSNAFLNFKRIIH